MKKMLETLHGTLLEEDRLSIFKGELDFWQLQKHLGRGQCQCAVVDDDDEGNDDNDECDNDDNVDDDGGGKLDF